MAGHAQAPAIDHGLCAFRNALADQAFDALLRHARDDRAHLGVKLVALAHFQGLHALAVADAFGVDVLGHRGRAHKTHRLDHRVRQDGIDDGLVALHDVEDAIGQARVTGNIHIGTMAGKMKGVIPTARPRGPCMAQTSMPRGFGQ